jgi:hypothetical protein
VCYMRADMVTSCLSGKMTGSLVSLSGNRTRYQTSDDLNDSRRGDKSGARLAWYISAMHEPQAAIILLLWASTAASTASRLS